MPESRIWFPSFEVKTCFLGKDYFIIGPEIIDQRFQLHLYVTIEVYLVFNFLMDALLMILLFLLRTIQHDFSITREFLLVTLAQLAADFLIFFFLIVDP